MIGSNWRENRIALVVGALALLGGTPAVLAAAKVTDPRVLGGATALAAVVVAFGAAWQNRYIGLVQRRVDQLFRTEAGCLVLSDGRLPRVRDITDPVLLGVHKAPHAAVLPGGHGTEEVAGMHLPAYVPRDFDAVLRQRLAAGGFVLLVGDSTAGKSRAAFEALAAMLAGHLLICPANRDAVVVAITRAAQARRCVLWLDDLESYLGTGGLTTAQLGRLVSGKGHHRVVIATIRAAEQARVTDESLCGDDAARQVLRDTCQVIEQAYPIRVPRMFSHAELERARVGYGDPRIAEALAHSGNYGIAEYLAAGPELLREWEDARNSSHGPNARGAALVAAAIDIRRAGHTSPIPHALVDATHEHYLDDPEHARTPREPIAEAWAWATRQRRATTALVHPTTGDRIEVFDYLVDSIQRRARPSDHVPEPVVRAAIDTGDQADADSLALTAYTQGRYPLAERAYRQACEAKSRNPRLGAEHTDTLASRDKRATVLRDLGRLAEAEAEHRAVGQIRARVLGAEHPDTLLSRDNLGAVLRGTGRLEEAEAEHRSVLDIRVTVLGPEHRDTMESRNNLALTLRDLGRLEEAETEQRTVQEICARVLGAEHPDTLAGRNNLALVLRDVGRFEDAEAEHRAVAEICARVLGAEHPDTLTSRDNTALDLRDVGRLEDAEAEHRAVAEIRARVLGAEHRDTLTSRDNRATALRLLERLEEAEAEHRDVRNIRARVLGTEHPRTLTSRDNLALVRRDVGRLEDAEAEHRAVAEIRARVLAAEHRDTLTSRDNRAIVLRLLGRLKEAEVEHMAVAEIRARVLGPGHPDTVTSRDNLAVVMQDLERFRGQT